MARKRMLSEALFNDAALLAVGRDARDLFIGLVLHADDEGRLFYEPDYWAQRMFPGESIKVPKLIWKLSRRGLVYKYRMGRKRYAVILPGWFNWQKIRRATPSQIPLPNSSEIVELLSPCAHHAITMPTPCVHHAITMGVYMRTLCGHYAITMRTQQHRVIKRKFRDRFILLSRVLGMCSGKSLEQCWKDAGIVPESVRQSFKEGSERKEEVEEIDKSIREAKKKAKDGFIGPLIEKELQKLAEVA